MRQTIPPRKRGLSRALWLRSFGRRLLHQRRKFQAQSKICVFLNRMHVCIYKHVFIVREIPLKFIRSPQMIGRCISMLRSKNGSSVAARSDGGVYICDVYMRICHV